MQNLNSNLQEKRRFERISEALPVRFKFSDRQDSVWQEGETQNISEGGLFIAKKLSPEAMGNMVHLDLELHQVGLVVRLICQVAWIKREKDMAAGVGLKIIQIEPREKQVFLTYICKGIPEKKAVPKLRFLRQPLFRLPDKQRRSYQILDFIRRFGPVSKAGICKAVKLNAMSVGKYIDDFLKINLVFDCGLDISSGGRRAQLFKLNNDFGIVLGLEINREKGYVSVLAANMGLETILEDKKLLKEGTDIKYEIISLIRIIIDKLGSKGSQILGIGIGFDRDEDKELRYYLEQEFNLPAVCEEGFHLESFAQSWIERELATKSVLYIHSEHVLSLILGGDIYKPEKEIEGKVELASVDLEEKALVLIELISPDIVYIADRVGQDVPRLKQTLKQRLKQAEVKEAAMIKVLTPDIDEKKAVAMGAASLVIKEVFIGVS